MISLDRVDAGRWGRVDLRSALTYPVRGPQVAPLQAGVSGCRVLVDRSRSTTATPNPIGGDAGQDHGCTLSGEQSSRVSSTPVSVRGMAVSRGAADQRS